MSRHPILPSRMNLHNVPSGELSLSIYLYKYTRITSSPHTQDVIQRGNLQFPLLPRRPLLRTMVQLSVPRVDRHVVQ